MKYVLPLAPLALLALALCTGCPVADDDDSGQPDVESFDIVQTLADYLSGEFDSSQQAADHPSYYSIQLITCEVHAPDLGEHVLYVEQATMDAPTQPYRQRLYALHGDAEAGTAGTTIYELTAPQATVGLCEDDQVASLEADEAVEREGCGVELTWDEQDETFEGGTVGQECGSTLNGASYATSEILLTGGLVESWDRGFDAAGAQVWGAVDGPYLFVRR